MKPAQHINFKYNLKIYWQFLSKYKIMFFGLLVIILLLEASYVFDSYVFKLLVDNAELYANQALEKGSFIELIWILAAAFIGVGLLRVGLKYLHIHLINVLDANLIQDLKTYFFTHILNLSYNFHTTHKTGSLISKLVRSGSSIERMTDVLIFNFAPLLFKLAIVAGAIVFLSPLAAAITIIVIVVFVVYTYLIQKAQEPHSVHANNMEDREKAAIGDYMTNFDSIKYFGKTKRITSTFNRIATTTSASLIRKWNYFRSMDAGHSFIIMTGYVLIFVFPLMKFVNNELSLGSLVFIYSAYSSLMGPLFSFNHGIRSYYQAMADFEVLFAYNKVSNEVEDLSDARTKSIRKGHITYDNVTFSYGARNIFDSFSLDIQPKQKIAFVGHSGCGKTTLIKLLYRLYDVQSGTISIDGENISSFKKESLRANMSIVPQECALFDDTIYNNIAFSKPSATRSEVMDAIKFAQLDTIIEHFPQKEHTIVGERGVRLSGGEKQRVSIARALLANKKILVLDEATSALDSHTEHEIQRDLEKLMKGRTTLIIAHRLSTIMKADTIVVMSRGAIVQMGSHDELIRKKGQYQKLWSLQKDGYIK